jgi:hypothetical protein
LAKVNKAVIADLSLLARVNEVVFADLSLLAKVNEVVFADPSLLARVNEVVFADLSLFARVNEVVFADLSLFARVNKIVIPKNMQPINAQTMASAFSAQEVASGMDFLNTTSGPIEKTRAKIIVTMRTNRYRKARPVDLKHLARFHDKIPSAMNPRLKQNWRT